MSRLVNQLLEIAELETFVIGRGETADLVAVSTEIAAFLAPLALSRTRRVAVTGAPRPGRGARQCRHARPRGAQPRRERARPYAAAARRSRSTSTPPASIAGQRPRAGRSRRRPRTDLPPVLAPRPPAAGQRRARPVDRRAHRRACTARPSRVTDAPGGGAMFILEFPEILGAIETRVREFDPVA